MEHEIIYERDIYKSYMKLSSLVESNFDEKIILSAEIPGVLPIKKHFVEKEGQYWYDISGKQDLDSYCKVNPIGVNLLEKLMIQMINLLEELEWNLIDVDSLCLRPELIFMNVVEEEFLFTLYPSTKQNIFQKLQEFMEFILTKLDHGDTEAVHRAYRMYECILRGEYTISDLKDIILDGRSVEKQDSQDLRAEIQEEDDGDETISEELLIENKVNMFLENILDIVKTKWTEIIKIRKKKEKSLPEIIYPEDEEEEERKPTVHPTVCLTSMDGVPKGQLLYEGIEHFPDYDIGQLMCVVGKSHRVKLQIDKDTISQFHAKIDWKEGKYYIEDMNSTNGTFVNEEMLNYKEIRELHIGDIIRFADVKYRFL